MKITDLPTIAIKIGKEEHIRKFHELGEVYFAPISHFKGMDNDDFRGDPNEGLFHLAQAESARIGVQIEDGKDEMSWLDKSTGLSGQVKLALEDDEKIGICSLSQAKYDNGTVYFNEDMSKFGPLGISILNSKKFMDRIYEFAKTNGVPFKSGPVEYVDHGAYTGTMGIFKKFKKYDWQNEIRIAVYNQVIPYKMTLGSLQDITAIFRIDKGKVYETAG